MDVDNRGFDHSNDHCEHGVSIHEECDKCSCEELEKTQFTCVECGVDIPIEEVIDGFCLRCFSRLMEAEEDEQEW